MYKRIITLYIAIVLCFMGALVRMVYIGRSSAYSVGERRSTRTLVVGEKRAGIYDRNGNRLTDTEQHLVAAVTPVMSVAQELKKHLSSQELEQRLKKGSPFLCLVDESIDNKYISTFQVSERYCSLQTAVHIIGYVNSDGAGVSGIEKAYDSFLCENSGKLSVSFGVDALGRVLAGEGKRVTDDNYYSQSGIMLTVDSKIQLIAEKALRESGIKSGGVLVLKSDTSEIVAMASVPEFNPLDVASSLSKENSPLVNKLLCSYAVGSVFKPMICAAALEQGIGPGMSFECHGSVKLGDTVFKCYEEKAHGRVDMSSALENSCNTYFINLIMHLDVNKLLSLCERAGLGKSTVLAPGLEGGKGNLPSAEGLKLKGNLANFAFGQGELTATALQIGQMYNALITGYSRSSRLVLGFLDTQGKLTEEGVSVEERIFSDSTVSLVKLMLRNVVERGNATNASGSGLILSGKTGTAQSGSYLDGKEIYRTWFAGFFPFDEPEYTVVIINENGTGGNSDCAPVFREICENIADENNLK